MLWDVVGHIAPRDGLTAHLLSEDAFNRHASHNEIILLPNAKGQTISGPYSSSIRG